MKIGIANDHGGYELKNILMDYLTNLGYEVVDYGAYSLDSCDDYPDFALKLCNGINNGEVELGIASCKAGVGMSIACNKVDGIRCAKVCNIHESKHSRIDNDSNIIAISACGDIDEIKDIIITFITTPFTHEERHERRVNKIREIEKL